MSTFLEYLKQKYCRPSVSVTEDAEWKNEDHPRNSSGNGGGQFKMKPENQVREDNRDLVMKEGIVESIGDIDDGMRSGWETGLNSDFERAGLSAFVDEIETDEDTGEITITVSAANPFPPVNYELGPERGYRDVWEDEAEIDEYKQKIRDMIGDKFENMGFEEVDYSTEPDEDREGSFGYKCRYVCKIP